MAREYNPQPKDRVKVRFSKSTRRIADRKVTIYTAECLEDGHKETGDSEAEAARYFAGHLSRKHPGRQVKKV